ncbi:uncharacterized protein LOC106167503 isoform X3 [Lingula anatina]|uniref:Uncharacterized protein LOC106167503 isoform X3 n=1 Tax=Lingula anatina TaxID=7574 RepID=A0A1S3IU69_LINAN|nr:uncharacterized protein LOC106167503 isoform X3 [Lingula anatina]|eukprot:XP_013401752.1 uncharacterized protein LOC106167503 isoform X3 [Lingula anatina]
MEVFKAICDFKPPKGSSSHSFLPFKKGDKFEVLEPNHTQKEWWGARALKGNKIGYIPAKYMKPTRRRAFSMYEERRADKALPENYKSQRDENLKKLADMQSKSDPDEMNYYKRISLEPDYDVDSDENGDASEPEGYPRVPVMIPYEEWAKTVTPDDDLPDVPEPDYNDEDEDALGFNELQIKTLPMPNGSSNQKSKDREKDEMDRHHRSVSEPGKPVGLIEPKKLKNPCLESRDRMELHRELLMNAKRGVDVLKKPELQRELSKRSESRRVKEWDAERKANRTSLEVQLEKQAEKLKEYEQKQTKIIEEEEAKPEFVKVGEKIRSRSISEKHGDTLPTK